jgi:hypothetical protein
MKKRYKISDEQGVEFARNQQVQAEVGDEREIELTMEQEKALVAAGWIEGPIEPKGKDK